MHDASTVMATDRDTARDKGTKLLVMLTSTGGCGVSMVTSSRRDARPRPSA
jgi:hypothetical protein